MPPSAIEPPVVSSHNEWDPLEEVILGIPDGAAVPPWHPMLRATMPEEHWDFFRRHGGQPFPAGVVAAARREVEALARRLETEGITVRFPETVDHSRGFATPDWQSPGGLYAAMPRDVFLVVGTEIIEAPMAWRCRFFETLAYRPLIKDYFRRGARWTAAPRPSLQDALYDGDGHEHGLGDGPGGPFRPVVTEFEPTFDAADFVRCGRDLFAQRSHVTNAFGIEWLRRHLGPAYAIHEVAVRDPHPMHIDATLVPLAAGKLLVNPERLPIIPPPFRDWEVRPAPPPRRGRAEPLYMSSDWIAINVFSLDERRVLVEREEEALIALLKRWGFEPIPCPFRGFNALGGSFHCATLDVRRRGGLQSYF